MCISFVALGYMKYVYIAIKICVKKKPGHKLQSFSSLDPMTGQ